MDTSGNRRHMTGGRDRTNPVIARIGDENVARWVEGQTNRHRFTDSRGDLLNDSSGHGNHGTIVGAKWVPAGGRAAATANSRQPADASTMTRLGTRRVATMPRALA